MNVPMIKAKRIASGRSAFSVAVAAKINPGRLSMIERGLVAPSWKERERLAVALGLPMDEVLAPAQLKAERVG